MKAMVITKYGPPEVLKLREVEKPVPKGNEVLIRVHATSVNYGDLVARNFKAISPRTFNMPLLFWIFAKLYFGVRHPKITILGSEFAGEIEATGEKVTAFKPGDQVFGSAGQSMGAYAEYLCMPERGCLALKPANLRDDEAATVPYGAIMALALLRKAPIQPGHEVLINGASGAIGSAAVQLAKHAGATVTGVCSGPRVAIVESLGADKVIDYTQEDFTQRSETYDLIFDVLGKASFARSKRALKPNGIHLYASFKTKQLLQMLWTSVVGNKRVVCAIAPGSAEDLRAVKALIEAGKMTSIIDQRFPLECAAEAHRYVEEGRRKGPITITVAHRQ